MTRVTGTIKMTEVTGMIKKTEVTEVTRVTRVNGLRVMAGKVWLAGMTRMTS